MKLFKPTLVALSLVAVMGCQQEAKKEEEEAAEEAKRREEEEID